MTKISKGIQLIVWLLCFLVSSVANIGIVWILRRHRFQLRSQHLYAENIRRKRDVAQTRSIGVFVGVYLLFNTLVFFAKIYQQILKQDIKTYNHY